MIESRSQSRCNFASVAGGDFVKQKKTMAPCATESNCIMQLTSACRGGPGRLALPGGPFGPASWWAATSDVELGQAIYPANKESVGSKGARDKVTTRKSVKEGVERGRDPS